MAGAGRVGRSTGAGTAGASGKLRGMPGLSEGDFKCDGKAGHGSGRVRRAGDRIVPPKRGWRVARDGVRQWRGDFGGGEAGGEVGPGVGGAAGVGGGAVWVGVWTMCVGGGGILGGVVGGRLKLELVRLSYDGAQGEIDFTPRWGDGQENGRRGGDVETEDGAGTAVRAADERGSVIVSVAAANQCRRRV